MVIVEQLNLASLGAVLLTAVGDYGAHGALVLLHVEMDILRELESLL